MSQHVTLPIQATIIPIGGNENKGDQEHGEQEFINHGILAQVVKESGGPEARIALITTASSIPLSVAENYRQAFEKLGCRNVEVLDIRQRNVAASRYVTDIVASSQCLLFSGGDQSRITKIIGGTPLHTLLKQRLRDPQFVLAGTSAGAMAMAHEMIAGGSSTEAMWKGAVQMKKGLSVLPQLIVDTHFIQRGRFGRLAEAVARHPQLLGIGLAEDTGLVIKQGTKCRVIGSGMVVVMDGSRMTHNNYDHLSEGMPLTAATLITHVLAVGDELDTEKRSVKAMELEAWKLMTGAQ